MIEHQTLCGATVSDEAESAVVQLSLHQRFKNKYTIETRPMLQLMRTVLVAREMLARVPQ